VCVIRHVILPLLLLVGTLASAEENPDLKAEVIGLPHLSSCYRPTEQLGRIPLANCEAKIKPKWAEEPTVYKFNKLGLRDKDYSPKPDGKTTRILLMGPMFNGLGLEPKETASYVLQERLKASGAKNVEVINAGMSGFFATRNSEMALRLLKEYSPDIVAYFQTGDVADEDLIEYHSIRFDGENIRRFTPPAAIVSSSPILGWLLPDPERQSVWGIVYHRFITTWKIRKQAKTVQDEIEAFLAPSVKAFQRIQAALRPDQKLVVFYAQRPARSRHAVGGLSRFWNSLMQRFVPNLAISPDLVTLQLRTAGLRVYPVEHGFRRPVQNELVWEEQKTSLTHHGVQAFVAVAVPALRAEIEATPKGKGMPPMPLSKRQRHRSGVGSRRGGQGRQDPGANKPEPSDQKDE
jgi:hypothetical protein